MDKAALKAVVDQTDQTEDNEVSPVAGASDVGKELSKDERMAGLVSGKLPPCNEYSAYLVTKLQKIEKVFKSECDKLNQLLSQQSQLVQQVNQQRTLVLNTQAAMQSGIEDLGHWDEKGAPE